jgi:hypothetical protein
MRIMRAQEGLPEEFGLFSSLLLGIFLEAKIYILALSIS